MEKMKITAGLSGLEAYDVLADASADEFFAGFLPFDWLEKYTNLLPLNRREVLMHNIQLDSFSDLRLLSRKIEVRGVPVTLTFNSIHYLPEQYPILLDMLSRLCELGFRDWILADPALILHIRKANLPGRIHLSSEAGCINPDAMAFFSRFDIHRWIFPRKITPEEMADCIAAVPGAQYEAFMLNERCQYSGAHCASLHCDELEHLCRVPYRPIGPEMHLHDAQERDPDAFGAGGCGLCALPRLRQSGITHLKLVGRGARTELLQRDIFLLRQALENGHADEAALRAELFPHGCPQNCYYPPHFAHKT